MGGRLERLTQRKSGWNWAGEGGRQEAWLRVWEEEQERGKEEFSVRHCKCGEPCRGTVGCGHGRRLGPSDLTLWEMGWELLALRSCRRRVEAIYEAEDL